MTHSRVSIATIYSSAQCVLSVVGSVGVILLFAGIPQLIYSPSISASNLLTFVMGAVLIMTMVAGNSFLNYKYRAMDREANRQGAGQGESGDGSAGSSGNPDDKPPSYESVLTLDGLPPEYSSIAAQKPPRYEEIVKETHTACGSPEDAPAPNTCETQAQATSQILAEASPSPIQQRIVVTLSKAEEEEDAEDERNTEGDRRDVLEIAVVSEEPEDTDQQLNRTPSSKAQPSVASEADNCVAQQTYGESET